MSHLISFFAIHCQELTPGLMLHDITVVGQGVPFGVIVITKRNILQIKWERSEFPLQSGRHS